MKNKIRNCIAMATAVATITVGGSMPALATTTMTPSSAIQPAMNKGDMAMEASMKKDDLMNLDFSTLVSNGTIDQTTADNITAYLKQKQVDMDTEMAKINSMTADEKMAYMTLNMDKPKVDSLTDMVNKAIITQAQADAIKAVMPKPDKCDTPEMKAKMKAKMDAMMGDMMAKMEAKMKAKTLVMSPVMAPVARINSTGSQVKLVQTALNKKGYKLHVDGMIGKLTRNAVMDYQKKNGLAVDGLVGPLTLAKLNVAPVKM